MTNTSSHSRINVGSTDRILRLTFGLAFLLIGGFTDWRLALIGIVLAATALFRWCPLYTIFGLSTCPAGDATPPEAPGS